MDSFKPFFFKRPWPPGCRLIAKTTNANYATLFDHYVNKYLPQFLSKNIGYNNSNEVIFRQHWEKETMYYQQELLYLCIHEMYCSLVETVGNEEQLAAAFYNVRTDNYDTSLISYDLYAKLIVLMLLADFNTCRRFGRLIWSSSSIDNHLNLIFNTMRDTILVTGNSYKQNNIAIKKTIMNDVYSHTAYCLSNLMAGKRILTGGPIQGITSHCFRLPVSQYIILQRNNTDEIYACDPDVDMLLDNLNQLHDAYYVSAKQRIGMNKLKILSCFSDSAIIRKKHSLAHIE